MAARLSILLFFVSMLLMSREPPWADANMAYQTTQAILSRGELQVHINAPSYFFTINQGRKYGFAALGNAIGLIPSYAAFRALRRLPGVAEQPLYALTSHLSSALWMALAAGSFYRLCRRRGASPRSATLWTLALGLGTPCLIYARSPYAEALQTFALLYLYEKLLEQKDKITYSGMALIGMSAGILFNTKLVYILLFPLCFIYLFYIHSFKQKPANTRRLLAGLGVAALAFLPFLGLVLFHNWVKTGSPLRTGWYPGQRGVFSGDLWAGVFGLWLSPGKGLLWYAPPLFLALLGLRRSFARWPAETALALGIAATVTGFSAKYQVWHGGFCWGPRYLVPIVPLVLLLAVPGVEAVTEQAARARKALWGGLCAVGLFVQLLGCALYWDHHSRVLLLVRQQAEIPSAWSEDHLPFGYYVPQFSPLVGHAWLVRHVLKSDADLGRDAPWKALLTAPIDLRSVWPALRIDWWALDWLSGPQQRRPAGLLTLGLFTLGAALGTSSLIRRLRREPDADPGAYAADPDPARAPSSD
jgi:hypothetical protein